MQDLNGNFSKGWFLVIHYFVYWLSLQCDNIEKRIIRLMQVLSHDTPSSVVSEIQYLNRCGKTYTSLIEKYQQEYYQYEQKYMYLPTWDLLGKDEDRNCLQAKTNIANKFRQETIQEIQEHNPNLFQRLKDEDLRIQRLDTFSVAKNTTSATLQAMFSPIFRYFKQKIPKCTQNNKSN